jgi:NitT/TauT family transport system substrate-binding protein
MIRRTVPTVLASLALLSTVLGSFSCSGKSSQTQTLRLGTLSLETCTLIFVAEEQGYFQANDLVVETKYYDTGLGALNALLAGEVDLAVPVGEYAMVGKVIDGEAIQTIGAIGKTDYQMIVGRKDRGIGAIADLKGKTIGVISKTQEEFYLTRFLELNGIKREEVHLASVTLTNSVDSLVNGEVDAVILVPPYTQAARDELGGNALSSWSVQASQLTHQLVIGRNDWVSRHHDLVLRFLGSISQAQDYLVHSPDQARSIVKKRLSGTDTDIDGIWARNQFGLTLDQSLIAAMEAEARWIMGNNLTTEKTVPNFYDYIYEDALEAVRPEAVNFIR